MKTAVATKKRKNEEDVAGRPKRDSNGAAKPARKRAARKLGSTKTSTPPVGTARRRKTTDGRASVPTHEEISLRAYFIAEQRLGHGLPGDANTDWLEARRQLYVEAGLPTDHL